MDEQGLFRTEAIEHQQTRLVGKLNIAQPPKSSILTFFIFTIVVALLSFIASATYTKKQTVSGYLHPEQGVAPVLTLSQGVLAQLYVKNGQSVKAGDPLALLKPFDQPLGDSSLNQQQKDKLTAQLAALTDQQDTLVAERDHQLFLADVDLQHATQTLALIDARLANLDERLAIQRIQQKQNEQLQKKGSLSRRETDAQRALLLAMEDENVTLMDLRNTKANAVAHLSALPNQINLNAALKQQDIQSQKLQYERELLSLIAQEGILITAPVDGIISNLVFHIGAEMKVGSTLLNLLPARPHYQGILFVPVDKAASLSPGAEVVIRYHSYPHQRFGRHHARIEHIPTHVSSPGEDNNNAIGPYYRVTLSLDSQSVTLANKAHPLRSGMTFDADIVYHKQTLASWLFEPLTDFKGRL